MYDPNYKVKDFYSYLERAKTLYGDKALFRFNKKTEVVDVSYEEFFNLVTKMALAFKELDIAGKKVTVNAESQVRNEDSKSRSFRFIAKILLVDFKHQFRHICVACYSTFELLLYF